MRPEPGKAVRKLSPYGGENMKLSCEDARRHWNLYHDSEGDAELFYQINEHLANCPGCAEWFYQQGRLEDVIASKLGPQEPTPALWKSVLEESGVKSPASSRRWTLFGGLLLLAASVLLCVGLWAWRQGSTARDLIELSMERHQELAMGRSLVEFESESDLAVEGYLRQRVSFPVRCPPREDAGFAVAGAGVCHLADSQSAYLVGRVDGTPVSIFIFPRNALARFAASSGKLADRAVHESRRGTIQTVMASIDQNVVLVVGQTNVEELRRVLSAYGTYPDGHHDG